MAPRWLPGTLALLACLAVPAGMLAPAAGGSRSRTLALITVKAPTVLHMSDSDIYCTVIKEGSTPAVACFHDPGGPTSKVRRGYALAAFDNFVAVEPPGSTKPVKSETEPSLASFPTITGGASHSKLVELSLNDGALVSGTHMAVAVETAKGGGNAIGVLFVDSKGDPIVGTSTVGISNHFITIVQVTGAMTSKVLWRHAVY
ncbi:MAG TPA: hypothetical protein VLV28_04330 [Gaiellaceae bacterium]|nr:hypothetical protein [Gaiellaceae bacterium]